MIEGESSIGTNDQVPYPYSKLDILTSTIDVAPLYILPPTNDNSLVEESMVEQYIGDLGKEVYTTAMEHVFEGK